MLFRRPAMPYLSFADLIRHRVPLSAPEAAALTLAVARVLDVRRDGECGLHVPGDDRLLLSNTGDVTFGGVEPSTEQEEIAGLASLLRRLLQLDTPGVRDRRGRVPGGLLVLLARALRQIDLGPPTRDEFLTALIRFAGLHERSAAALAVVFWRAAGLRPGLFGKQKALGLLPPARDTGLAERRQHGPPASELRRALRDLERELYERPGGVRGSREPRRRERRAAVAAALIGAMLIAILAGGGALNHVPDGAETIAPEASEEKVLIEPIEEERPAPIGESSLRSVPMVTPALVGSDVFSPSFGPRGQTIYFHAGRTAAPLMRATVEANGTVAGITKLLDDGATNYHVTVSPDGRLIAYDSDRDGVRSVYIAGADGRYPRRISGSGYAAVPSWSPDGRRVAFVRAEPRRPAVWNIWVAEVAGGALRRITAHKVGQRWGASWFPDGRRLAYSHEEQLVIADLQTGGATVIASPRRGRLVRTPAVSPDGSRVVFQVHGDGMWMLDVTRMRLRRILPDPSAEEFVWSPNGRTVAYHARSRDGWGVWKVDL